MKCGKCNDWEPIDKERYTGTCFYNTDNGLSMEPTSADTDCLYDRDDNNSLELTGG